MCNKMEPNGKFKNLALEYMETAFHIRQNVVCLKKFTTDKKFL